MNLKIIQINCTVNKRLKKVGKDTGRNIEITQFLLLIGRKIAKYHVLVIYFYCSKLLFSTTSSVNTIVKHFVHGEVFCYNAKCHVLKFSFTIALKIFTDM